MSATLGTVIVALGCCGCESSQQESARLEKQAKHAKLAVEGVKVERQSPKMQVVACTVVHGRQTDAVVVSLRDLSPQPIADAPIEITARDTKRAVVFQNDAAGEDPSLTHVALLEPGRTTVWIDDQVQAKDAMTASARVGEGERPTEAPPLLRSSAVHTGGEGSEAAASGTLRNDSKATRQHVVVYGVARRDGAIVGAARAIVPEVSGEGSAPFQMYFVGSTSGASVQTSVAGAGG